jgi:ribosomal protein S18 acetylase RimI-like enzyme
MKPAYPITIRRATASDAAAIAALSRMVMVATFVDEFQIPYDPSELADFLAKSHGEARFRDQILDPAVDVLVAEISGELAGYASAGPMTLPHPEAKPGERELYRLYVPHAFHGQGVAAALLAPIIGGIDWIGVWSGNIRAQRVYARYGFEKAGEYDYRVGHTVDREFIMRRVKP